MTYPVRSLVTSHTPYRISLGGGGTDLPFYSNERGGYLISAAINQYVKVSLAHRPLDERILVQTTDTQFADSIDEVDHQQIREALKYFYLTKAVQVATFTTIPTGLGLGSSSTLMVGLIKSISSYLGKKLSPMEIGFIAHHLEREVLELSGGIQDQFIAALGGIQRLKVDQSGKVSAEPILIDHDTREKLQESLILVFADGSERDSTEIIRSQQVDLNKTIEVYDQIKYLGAKSEDSLIKGDIKDLGEIMDEHWRLKKTLSHKISNNNLDDLYSRLKKLGSPGGKIIGAGGGGFFMMAVPGDSQLFIEKVNDLGCRVLNWEFEFMGTHHINELYE